MTNEEIAKQNRLLQGRLRKMLREAWPVGELDIRYIRRGWGDKIVCAVVFDQDSEDPSILVVDDQEDGWLWALDRWR